MMPPFTFGRASFFMSRTGNPPAGNLIEWSFVNQGAFRMISSLGLFPFIFPSRTSIPSFSASPETQVGLE
jgi:hypothetical protein